MTVTLRKRVDLHDLIIDEIVGSYYYEEEEGFLPESERAAALESQVDLVTY